MLISLAVTLSVSVLVAPLQEDAPRSAREYEGCYVLTLSAWKPATDFGEDGVFSRPPAAIELTGTRGESFFEKKGFLVRPALGAEPSIHDFAYWHLTPERHIEIVWTTGFSGLFMDLTEEGGNLVGVAETFWDFPRPTQTAEVQGEKVSCRENP